MYRSFLSWRYLFARRTNLIGMVGILVAVAALILILSIMTGFLDASRDAVRGSLADIIIEPNQGVEAGSEVPRDPYELLHAVRSDERVQAATSQLIWAGLITQRGKKLDHILASQGSTANNPILVQLVGIDTAGPLRVTWPALQAAVRTVGGILPDLHVQDEFDTTRLLAALTGEASGPTLAPVENPLFPFAPPSRRPRRGRPKASVLVGEQLFDIFNMRRGDILQIGTIVQDPETGEWPLNNREFVVAGTFRSGQNEADMGRIYLDRGELSDFLGHFRDYTQVLVAARDYEHDAASLTADLRRDLAERGLISEGPRGPYEVRTWEEFRVNLLGAIENERVLMAIMLSLVLVVAGFTIFAILSMMVSEKRRDIGILLALGATPRGIRQMFLFIAFWDALLGSLAGALLGTWGALRIDPLERALSRFFGVEIFNRQVYLFDHIPSIVQPLAVALIVLGAFACALLFAAIPAWRASKLDPLAALRYE
ncbi:MAG TPA: ABC transporter permease [Planctomycetes bacterium]|nr:ABC transporter permease [Planctomycetota bacterium]